MTREKKVRRLDACVRSCSQAWEPIAGQWHEGCFIILLYVLAVSIGLEVFAIGHVLATAHQGLIE
jgi:hypothetical protein